jgi:competence protein ComEC
MNAIAQGLIGLAVILTAGCTTSPKRQEVTSSEPPPALILTDDRASMIESDTQLSTNTALEKLTPSSKLKRPHQFDQLLSAGAGSFAELAAAVENFAPKPISPKQMAVHAIDVGQGDAFLLEFQCGAVLVDTGLQPMNKHRDRLIEYVDWFFNERRTDLNRTLDLAVISHSHADHANGVPHLFGSGSPINLAVSNQIDNGFDTTGGKEEQVFLRSHAQNHWSVLVEQIMWTDGATSAVIDPIGECDDGVDPILRVLWGGWADIPGALENPNHHSVVLRVDYGEASFLFTGDLQTNQDSTEGGGLNLMLDDYQGDLSVFNVDALKVSHHGAENGTTPRLLQATTPCLAFMGVGPAEDGGIGAAAVHGHPRRATLDLLDDAVSSAHPRRSVWSFDAGHGEPRKQFLSKAIFGTAWDGHYVIYATSNGKFSVESEKGDPWSASCMG